MSKRTKPVAPKLDLFEVTLVFDSGAAAQECYRQLKDAPGAARGHLKGYEEAGKSVDEPMDPYWLATWSNGRTLFQARTLEPCPAAR